MAESVNSSDSESDFSNRDVRLRGDESGTESSYSSDEHDELGIQPYRFEPEASESDSSSDGEAQHDAQAQSVAVAHDIDRLQNTEW